MDAFVFLCLCVCSRQKTWRSPIWAPWLMTPLHGKVCEVWDLPCIFLSRAQLNLRSITPWPVAPLTWPWCPYILRHSFACGGLRCPCALALKWVGLSLQICISSPGLQTSTESCVVSVQLSWSWNFQLGQCRSRVAFCWFIRQPLMTSKTKMCMWENGTNR